MAPVAGLAVHAGRHGEVAVPWADVHRESGALAARLAQRGVGHGDAVVAIGTSTYETLLLLFATWRCGAAISFVPPAGPAARDELARRAQVLGARAIYGPRRWSEDRAGPARGPTAAEPLRLDEEDVARWAARARAPAPAPATPVRPAGMAWPPPDVAGEDVAVYQATSGTTGDQKLVPVTWAMLLRNLSALAERWRLDETEHVATWMPLYHDMGLVAFAALPAFLGARLTMVATEVFARAPGRFLGLVAAGRATMSGSPTFGLALMERSLGRIAEPLDLSSLVRIGCGAEMIDLTVCERFLGAGRRHGLRSDVLSFGYGMAEATVAVTLRPPSPLADAADVADGAPAMAVAAADPAAGWIWPSAWGFARTGRPVGGVDVRIAAAGAATAPEGVVGEIEVRGDSVFAGYRPGSASVPSSPTRPAGGWFRTGDLGYLSAGELVVVGRTKDVVKVGGRHVVPDAVERVVADLPGVRTVAALPVRGRAGEGVGVVVERRPRSPTTARDVRLALRSELEITPEVVRFVAKGRLPRTTSGKLRRLACRPLLDGPAPTAPAPSPPSGG